MKFDRVLGSAGRRPLRPPQNAVAAVELATAMPGPATRTLAKVAGVDPNSELGCEEEISDMENSHAVTRDQADQNKTKPDMVDYLRHAQKKSGRHPMGLVREYLRLHRMMRIPTGLPSGAATLVLVVLLAGCFDGGAKFDTSSAEAYRASLAKVHETLPPERGPALEEALAEIALSRLTAEEDAAFARTLVGGVFKAALQANTVRAAELVVWATGEEIHGKTADEVIRLAKEKKFERIPRPASRPKAVPVTRQNR